MVAILQKLFALKMCFGWYHLGVVGYSSVVGSLCAGHSSVLHAGGALHKMPGPGRPRHAAERAVVVACEPRVAIRASLCVHIRFTHTRNGESAI